MLPLRWNGKACLERAWLARKLLVVCPTRETVGRRKPSSSASTALKMKALLLLVLPWLSPANYIDNVGNLHFLYSELWVRTVAPASCSLSVCLTRVAGRGSPWAFWGVCLPVCLCLCIRAKKILQRLANSFTPCCFPSGGLIIAVHPHCFLFWKQLRRTEWSCFFPYQLVFLCQCLRCLLIWGFFSISESVFFLYFL